MIWCALIVIQLLFYIRCLKTLMILKFWLTKPPDFDPCDFLSGRIWTLTTLILHKKEAVWLFPRMYSYISENIWCYWPKYEQWLWNEWSNLYLRLRCSKRSASEFCVRSCTQWTLEPITVIAQSKAWNVFARSNTGIVVLNSTPSMDVCVRLFCVCVFYVCRYRLCDRLIPRPSSPTGCV
jgi:hypothetical protein